MEWAAELFRYFVFFFEIFSFFYIVFQKPFRTQTKRSILGIILCCSVVSVSEIAGWELEGDAAPVTVLSVLFFIILFFIFEVSVVEMIGLAVGEWLIISLLETSMQVGIAHFNLERYRLEIMIMLFISICLWMYYILIGKKLEREMFQLPVKVWYLLDFIMLILTAMIEFFSYVIVMELPEGRVTGAGKVLVIAGGDLIIILLFAMIYYFNRTKSLQLQNEMIETQREQQKEYFLQLLKKEEETRSFRHDIINDLLEIQNYCEQQDYDKLTSYLENTLGVIQNISKSSYNVGNDIINTVLNYYLQPMKEKYEVEVIGYADETISIEQRDLCTVSANLIKNAVEAVNKLEYGKIVFDINQGTQYLSIKVTNTFEGKLKLDKDGLPKTTKKDERNHGIGLQNVKQVVQKYEGRYVVDIVEDNYQVEIFLKLG